MDEFAKIGARHNAGVLEFIDKATGTVLMAISTTAVNIPSLTIDGITLDAGSVIDLNGIADSLVIDADGDTTISAPTDDQIDFEISGADDFVMVANIFRALSGSVIESDTINETTSGAGVTIDSLLIKDGKVDLNGIAGAFILDADADTHIGASTDDQIDITVSAAIDFVITANLFTAVAGSVIATNTISETTSGSGVTIDGLLIKDSGITSPIIVTQATGAGSTFVPFVPLGAHAASVAPAGAIPITNFYSTLDSTAGATTATLADGAIIGQLKKIQMIVDNGDVVVTPANLASGTTITFADVGDFVVLAWNGTDWVMIEAGNAADGVTAPVLA